MIIQGYVETADAFVDTHITQHLLWEGGQITPGSNNQKELDSDTHTQTASKIIRHELRSRPTATGKRKGNIITSLRINEKPSFLL